MTVALTMNNPFKTQEVIQDASKALAQSSSESPRLDAELLLCHVLSCTRIDLLKAKHDFLSQEDLNSFKKLLQRRQDHEPIAHILGKQEFYGHTFKVTKETLIPRPETELLVEAASKYLSTLDETAQVIDLGTGTGCIPISLSLLHPEASICAVDIHEKTLETAKENAEKLGATQVVFSQKDILQKEFWEQKQSYDLIISNPPYISKNEVDSMSTEVLKHEPKRALFADNKGLKFYEVFAKFGMNILSSHGLMFLELSPMIYGDVCKIFEARGWFIKETIHDFAGLKRHIIVQTKAF